MIGDLGSQVEQTSSVDQKRLPSLDLGGAVNARSSETEASVDMGVEANGHSSKNHQSYDETNSDLHGNHTMPQFPEDTNSVIDVFGADHDGHLIVKDRFWTIFCKEVSLKPAGNLSLHNHR